MVGKGNAQERIGRRKSVGKLPRYALLPGLVHQHGINAAVCLYAAGFVITNLHLASLGVVRLDLLSARYILSGLLFVLFLCAVVVPLRGLLSMLRLKAGKPWFALTAYSLGYSLITYTIILVGVSGLQSITGGGGLIGKDVLLPTAPNASYSRWLAIDLRSAAGAAAAFAVLGVTLFMVVILVEWLASLPWKMAFLRLTGRRSRPGHIQMRGELGIRRAIRRHKLRTVATLFLQLFMLVLAFTVIVSFLRSVGVADPLRFAGNSSFLMKRLDDKTSILYSGWGMFFGVALALYATAAIFLLSSAARAKYDTPDDTAPFFGIPSGRQWLSFQMWVMGISIVLPLYCLSVYPGIPQQAGGGRIVEVQVLGKTPELLKDFQASGVRAYLVDRTAGTTLFLVVSGKPASERIVEVANSEIACMTYKH